MDSFAFDEFTFECATGELRRNGEAIKLKPQAARLLEMLLAHAGDLVSRDTIRSALWEGETFVDFDLGINSCIRQIRGALGDDANEPRFVETLPKKGYRFISPVRGSTDGNALDENADLRRGFRLSARRKTLIALGVAALIAAAVWVLWPVRQPETSLSWSDPVPLTALPGQESWPALSPDESTLAFLWKPEGADTFDLYVKLIDEDNPLRLTSDPANESSPTWSPDGRHIAFLREESISFADHLEFHNPETEHGIFIVPALGGPERRLGTSKSSAHGLSWSPDGEYLALVDKDTPGEPDAIFLIATEGGEKKRVTRPLENFKGDRCPVFAPDGQSVAFIRSVGAPEEDVFVVARSGGEPVRLTRESRHRNGLTWTPDGSGIVYASGPPSGRGSRLWRVSRQGGDRTPEAVSGSESSAYLPTLSRSGKLVYQRRVVESNIWRVPGPLADNLDRSTRKLIVSTGFDWMPAFSPDGRQIAFSSDRSGTQDIWLADSDGRNARSLIDWPETQLRPQWSPDGRHIVFYSFGWEGETGTVNPERAGEIYIVTVEGGAVRRLTHDPALDLWPSWSRDGQSIYFFSNRGSREASTSPTRLDGQVWKIPAAGGPAVQVTTGGAGVGVESFDGEHLYFARYAGNGIWSVPVKGGKETPVSDQAVPFRWGLYSNGICYVSGSDPLRPLIECLDLSTHRVEEILEVEVTSLVGGTLSVSPDGKWILYSQNDVERADIMLIETGSD